MKTVFFTGIYNSIIVILYWDSVFLSVVSYWNQIWVLYNGERMWSQNNERASMLTIKLWSPSKHTVQDHGWFLISSSKLDQCPQENVLSYLVILGWIVFSVKLLLFFFSLVTAGKTAIMIVHNHWLDGSRSPYLDNWGHPTFLKMSSWVAICKHFTLYEQIQPLLPLI